MGKVLKGASEALNGNEEALKGVEYVQELRFVKGQGKGL